jgi:hypothetical protein
VKIGSKADGDSKLRSVLPRRAAHQSCVYPSDKHLGHLAPTRKETDSLISKAHKIVKEAFNMGQLKGSFDDEEKRRKRVGNRRVLLT